MHMAGVIRNKYADLLKNNYQISNIILVFIIYFFINSIVS